MPGLEKTQHISLTSQVENGLKHQLSIGALKPGARLITKNIAAELGISITPVREALLRLVSARALAIAPAQAFMVPEISLAGLNEIHTIRCELEGMAVAAAAGQMSEARLQSLRHLLEEYRQAYESGAMEARLLANRAFRFQIYAYANMPTLSELIEQLWVRMGPGLHFLYGGAPAKAYRHSVDYYQNLLAALESGDKELSRRRLLEVIHKNSAIVKQQYASDAVPE
ncbi:GntR family transcriptional regulator [Intestinirhabdus alba]|uniref:GntR family transcriptional regulator n=1 Tax=Intestinirhabdus alba TaxID=2899544 RepID=A0A6L6IKA7_9ENTR|nr:GntR family transcriptional regulator [Intestinirhabdus alba]MTH46006.1 GntR family transcriptional regulator [Intestinirhabdus alba]